MHSVKIYSEHMQVLKTMQEDGLITNQAMRSIRGQLKSMKHHQEREIYLKKIISRTRREINGIQEKTKR